MKEGRKPEYPEKTPGDELQKGDERMANQLEWLRRTSRERETGV